MVSPDFADLFIRDINITVHDYANLRSPDSEHNLAGSYALPRETFVNAYNCYAFLTK